MALKKYFSSPSAAERYQQGRPHYHHLSIERIFNHIDKDIELALDLACGTGLSTVALAEKAQQVIGIDQSEEMLRLAPSKANIRYQLGKAEAIDLADQSIDLITVASGLHWFDFDTFFGEANRLLTSGNYLVVYENYFNGASQQLGEVFQEWFYNSYIKKFPSPPRNKFNFKDTKRIKNYGFELEAFIEYENSIRWTRAELVRYYTTQSNIINAVELGHYPLEEVEQWLHQELSTFMNTNEQQDFIFKNYIAYFKRAGALHLF